jgi:hypothetical protein
MSEFRIVEVYGIKIDARCAALLKIVIDFGGSGSSHQRDQADRALEKLGESGCTRALQYVVEEFSGSGGSHQRGLASRALEIL